MKKKIHVVALLLIVVFILLAVGVYIGTDLKFSILPLEEGWTVSMDGEELGTTSTDLSLRDICKDVKEGDTVILRMTLPETERTEYPAMLFRTRYCAYEIFLEGRLVCRGGYERLGKEKYVGKEYHLISLPEHFGGKEMEIHLMAEAAKDRQMVSDMYLGDYEDLENSFTHRMMLPLAIGAFLVVYGLFFFLVTLVVFVDLREFGVHGFAALLCFSMGVMLHLYLGLDALYMDTSNSTTFGYLAMWMVIPISMQMVYRIPGMLHTSYYRLVEALCDSVMAVTALLHFIGAVHFNDSIGMMFVVGAVSYVLVLLDFAYNRKQGELSSSAHIYLVAVVWCITWLLCSGVYLSMISRGAIRVTLTQSFAGIVGFCIGPMLFGYYMLVNYLFNATNSYAKEREYASLTRLAYSDGLTNLPNRSKLDAYLDQLEEKKMDYCIISMDVNGLKKVNDTYGHVAGDMLLKDFAGVLSEAMESVTEGICGRIGGDEFMIVLDRGGKEDKVLQKIDEGMEALNIKGEHPWTYSVASGSATRNECLKSTMTDIVHATYLLADQRMYEMKREQHGRMNHGQL